MASKEGRHRGESYETREGRARYRGDDARGAGPEHGTRAFIRYIGTRPTGFVSLLVSLFLSRTSPPPSFLFRHRRNQAGIQPQFRSGRRGERDTCGPLLLHQSGTNEFHKQGNAWCVVRRGSEMSTTCPPIAAPMDPSLVSAQDCIPLQIYRNAARKVLVNSYFGRPSSLLHYFHTR